MKKITLIKTNGEESEHEFIKLTITELKKLVIYEVFDTVNLRDGRIMMVDDEGHIKKNPPPVNPVATALYHSVCVPGTTWPILGDIIITYDEDWS